MVENHGTREEVVKARESGEGLAVRRSHTTTIDTLYAAAQVRNSPVAFARVALPLTTIDERISNVRRMALVGLAFGLGAALILTYVVSALIGRRVRAVAETARRYQSGDFDRPARDFGTDELGVVANVLDQTARELGMRLTEMARERAHMDAILTGMAEGVLLVGANGHLVLTNPAARSMLRLPPETGDTHYVERATHPRRSKCSSTRVRAERSSRTACRSRPRAVAAPCSYCATSPTCGAPIRCAGTSSRTSRTSYARRSRQSAVTWRRCRIRRDHPNRPASSSRSSIATRFAWRGS
jgi:PAS domain-containing protein